MLTRAVTVVGFYGPILDGGPEASRWDHWRPSIDLAGQPDLVLQRFHLIHDPPFAEGARLVAADIRQLSTETEVVLHEVPIKDPWDFEEVYGSLHDFAVAHPIDTDREDLLVGERLIRHARPGIGHQRNTHELEAGPAGGDRLENR